MSAQSVQMDSEASSQSSDSGPVSLALSQLSRKPKQRNKQCRYVIQYTLQTDLFCKENAAAPWLKLSVLSELGLNNP